jgi:DNA end-binding protein Ku
MDLASHIVRNKSGHFDPSHFEDRYENALIDLLEKKQAGEKIVPVRGAPPQRVVNLMDALRASVDTEKKEASAPSTRARRPGKKKASQKRGDTNPGWPKQPMTPVELDSSALESSVAFTGVSPA